METKFQTSFIPKRPLVPEQSVRMHGSNSIFMIIGMLIFIVSLGGAGFTFVAEKYLINAQEQLKIDLKDREKKFDSALIEKLKKANTKIDIAKEILSNHIATSEIFDIIAGLTIEGVYFQSLDISKEGDSGVSGGGNTGIYKIGMKGLANSFSSVAFQSDVLGKSEKYGTNKVIKNPILSNLAVDDGGNVSFDFSAEISQSDINYEKILNEILQEEGFIENNNELPPSVPATTTTATSTN